MSTTPKTQTATGSLVAALAELDNVKANKINPAFKAKYVSLDALLDAIKPVLLDHDLALIQTLVSEDGKVGVSTAGSPSGANHSACSRPTAAPNTAPFAFSRS